MRVPVPDGSLVDLTVELEKPVTVDDINNAMKQEAETHLHGILAYCEEPIVSSDIIGDSHSSIFDPALTLVLDGNFVKVVAWYDNEWGYSSRVEEMITRLAEMDAG